MKKIISQGIGLTKEKVMKKIRFGIVGIGNQGSYYAGLFKNGKIDNGELTCVCDINKEKIKLFQNNNPNIKTFENYKDMVKSGLCDVVLVETPHYFHPEIVEFCLESDVNVLCDKPAGVYVKHVREMNLAAERSRAKFGMMFNQRTNCVYRKMREMIKDGKIGELIRVTWIITDWFRTQAYYDNGAWRATWKGEGGGVLINQCPHQLDLIQWVLGEMPIRVRAFCKYGQWHDIEVEDEVTAYLEYKNGATGVFITTTGEAPGTNRFEVSGSKGKLICENGKLTWFKNAVDIIQECKTTENGFFVPKCEISEVETDGKNPQHIGILNNFANHLLGKEELFVDGRDGINGVELMNAIELSGWNDGETVSLPIDDDRYYKELSEHCKNSRVKTGTDKVVDTSGSFGTK